MKKIAVILIDGFEEVEALFPVDILRRANLNVDLITINQDKNVKSSHNVVILADKHIDEVDFEQYNAIFLPGGLASKEYEKYEKIKDVVLKMYEDNKIVSAICAGPMFLAKIGILKGKKATIYSGFEKYLLENGSQYVNEAVVESQNVITGRSVAAACDFGLMLLKKILCEADYEKMKKEIIYY